MQLPGGALYAPALNEAAAKTGARSGLSEKTAKALLAMVTASIELLNSGDSSAISLEMQVHEDTISAKVTGKACDSPTKRLVTNLDKLAAKKARSFTSSPSKSALTISFEV